MKRESAKDNGNSQLIALKVDIEKEQKKSKELKLVLEDKIKLVRKIENERNQAENDNALLKSEKKVTAICFFLNDKGLYLNNV